MEIEELQRKIPALDKSSKLLDQKFVSLVKNSEKCNNMPEIIIRNQCIETKLWGTGWWYKKTWRNIKTFKREEKEALKFLFEVFKIYFFGLSSRPIVTFLN